MTLRIPENAVASLKDASSTLEKKAKEGSVRQVAPGKIVGYLVSRYLNKTVMKELEAKLLGE